MNAEHDLGALSEDEVELIKARRREQARVAAVAAERLKALRAAADYEAWLQEHGRGSTYSTFVNEFDGDSRLWDLVEALREALSCK